MRTHAGGNAAQILTKDAFILLDAGKRPGSCMRAFCLMKYVRRLRQSLSMCM